MKKEECCNAFGAQKCQVKTPDTARAGEAEYHGIVKVIDLGELEAWVKGKLEFRIVVNNSTGTIIKDLALGKIKRKHLRDQKIYDANKFLCYWNTANIGNWMIEGWIEEDGGASSVTVSQSFPASCTGCATTNVSYTKQINDQDLGRTLIQFTDPKTQWYPLSYIDIKHK